MILLLASILSFSGSAHAGESLLILGDSHTTSVEDLATFPAQAKTTTSPGLRLDSVLRTIPGIDDVSVVGSCGATTVNYLMGTPSNCGFFERYHSQGKGRQIAWPARGGTPLLSSLLNNLKPSWTLFILGGNFLIGYQESTIRNSVKKAVQKVLQAGSKCIWVSPPDIRMVKNLSPEATDEKMKWILSVIKSEVGASCQFVETQASVRYPHTGGDGVHYSALSRQVALPLVKAWATGVCSDVTRVIFGSADSACAVVH